MLLQNLSVLRLEGRIEATLQPAVRYRLLRLPTRFFTGRSTGELAGAAMGISSIRRVLSGIGPMTVQAGTVGTVNLVLLLTCSVPPAPAGLALLLVVAAAFLGPGLWQLCYQRQLIGLEGKLNNRAFQTLRGLPKLRVAAAESFAYAARARKFARTRALQQRIGRIKNVVTVLNAACLPLYTLVMFALPAGPGLRLRQVDRTAPAHRFRQAGRWQRRPHSGAADPPEPCCRTGQEGEHRQVGQEGQGTGRRAAPGQVRGGDDDTRQDGGKQYASGLLDGDPVH